MRPDRRRLLLFALSALLSACPRRESPPPHITLGPERLLADLVTPVTAGDSRGVVFVIGTAQGRVLLRGADGRTTALDSTAPSPGHSSGTGGAAHDGPIVTLALSADGTRLMSAGGRSVAAWDVARRALIRRVSGPQRISAALLAPDGATAYFGTDEGHILRWRLGEPRAEALPRLTCAGRKVSLAELRLPESRRCTFGTYVEPPQGGAICAYPVTALALRGAQLSAACREGTVSFNDLSSGRRSFYLAGHLRAIAPVGDTLVLLGRAEGELRLYDVPAGKVARELQPAGSPDALAADGDLLVVAHERRLHLWHAGHTAALAGVDLPRRAVWLSLSATELRALLVDGRFVAYSLRR